MPLKLLMAKGFGFVQQALIRKEFPAQYLNDDRLDSQSRLSARPGYKPSLQRLQSKIPNQLGRLTDRPTLRWLFQCFQSIHVLGVRQSVEISNLTNQRLSLLKFFPPACQRYYLLS
jgi:hypothetical protein